MCGTYSIINALRAACYKEGISDKISWRMLFRIILKQHDAKWRLAEMVTEGTDTPDIMKGLLTAAEYLKRCHGISVKVKWPWKARRTLDAPAALARLSKETKLGHVVLLGYDGHKYAHWTVVTDITDEDLMLMDSSHGPSLPLGDFSFHPDGHLARNQTYVITPWSLATIKVTRR
ncbi:hypothetical protein [Aestuariivirga sp.]|uniref:hypothetical protein n=1 Tax=Aestuariivirga sp. TaxID=2650926 RepID=UPI0039E6797C